MDFTAYFITDFTADFIIDFTADFMLNYHVFIICIRISLKSTRFHEIHSISQDFTEINFIMDFTVDSIPVKSVMKFIMKSANEIHSEIHNEILLILVKSVEFNDILK